MKPSMLWSMRCGAGLVMLGAIGFAAAASAQSRGMPDELIGVWSEDDADGRDQCAAWRKNPVARDDGYDPLVGAVVITVDLIHSYADYGEGNFYRIEQVDAVGAASWQMRSRLYIDVLPSDAPASPGEEAPPEVADTMTLKGGKLVWASPETGTRTLFRCGDLAAVPAQAVERPGTAPDRISYFGTGNGWVGGQTEWSIDQSGRGMYRTTIRQKLDGKFNVGPQGFERIRAILQPLEDVRELPCDGAVDDQGMGTLSWRRGRQDSSLRFDFGCNFHQPDAARDLLADASELVAEWALAEK